MHIPRNTVGAQALTHPHAWLHNRVARAPATHTFARRHRSTRGGYFRAQSQFFSASAPSLVGTRFKRGT